jgi:DNA-binding XRE family transcriptional regulator
MSKISFVFTKEMAENLKKIREKARLSQIEVAKRIGLTYKTADSFISHLEKGRIKNPSLGVILLYLRACGESWSEFFKHLDAIDFRTRHENLSACGPACSAGAVGRHAQAEMIASVHPPPTQRKIQRDAMRYEIGIEFPSKEKPKRDIDFDRLKSRIEGKVSAFLIKNEIEENQASFYQRFVREYFDFLATVNKSGMKAVTDKWQRTGLKTNILFGLKKIVNNVLRAEIKRISAKKPLPSEKQQKMAIGFTKYRIRIEKIEAEVHKLLCELSVPTPWFALYKGFTRECYRVLKKYYGKNQDLLNKTLTDIIERWKREGLKDDVLLKLKDKIISVFGMMGLRGEV